MKPGTYRLRVGAIDANGRTGLIDDKVVAEILKAGPLQMSGLLLGLSAGAGFAPRLQFSTEPSVSAYLEVYGVGQGARVGAQFEIAKTTNGPALQTFREATSRRRTRTASSWSAPRFPLRRWLRATTSSGRSSRRLDQPATRVIRTLHKQ